MAICLQAVCQMLLHWIKCQTITETSVFYPSWPTTRSYFIFTYFAPTPPPFLPNRGSFMNSFKANGSTQFSVFILPSPPPYLSFSLSMLSIAGVDITRSLCPSISWPGFTLYIYLDISLFLPPPVFHLSHSIGLALSCTRGNFQTNWCRPHPVRGIKLLREPCIYYLQTIIVSW